jgi:hypothetical protein
MNKNKGLIFAVIMILILSSFGVAFESAVAAMPSSTIIPTRLTSASWIRINGLITKWGTTDVKGLLQTQYRAGVFQSGDTRQLAGATAIWTTNLTRPIQAVQTKQNFTYVFYAARLLNSSVSNVTPDSGSYSIEGEWNVVNVTSTVSIITNDDGQITKVLRNQEISPQKVNGILTITGNTFTLTLDAMDALTGSVFRSITRTWYNPYQMTDDTTTNIVTRTDVKTIAQYYGVMPGWGTFDLKMDFNNNFRIDIADISTVAANM